MSVQTEENKRFGVIAVEKGFIDQESVVAALATQVNDNLERGAHRRIGTILFDQGLLTASQIHDVLSNINSCAKLAT